MFCEGCDDDGSAWLDLRAATATGGNALRHTAFLDRPQGCRMLDRMHSTNRTTSVCASVSVTMVWPLRSVAAFTPRSGPQQQDVLQQQVTGGALLRFAAGLCRSSEKRHLLAPKSRKIARHNVRSRHRYQNFFLCPGVTSACGHHCFV